MDVGREDKRAELRRLLDETDFKLRPIPLCVLRVELQRQC